MYHVTLECVSQMTSYVVVVLDGLVQACAAPQQARVSV
jgi:hypothetical protein